jgi:hypothetical protein
MKTVTGLCVLMFVCSLRTYAQSPAAETQTQTAQVATATQALQTLQKSLIALSPNFTTRDVTLSGTVHHISGDIDENGTVSLEAVAAGASKIVLDLPSGQFIEVRDLTANAPAGRWSRGDGVNHPIAVHNLFNEPSWFSPVAIVSRLLFSRNSVASLVGTETLGSQSVQHITVYQVPPATELSKDTYPHLTQVDLYLDSATFLPAAVRYDIHPDDNESADIPVEIVFSDYQSAQGTQVPHHIQRLINNGLTLDVQIESVTLNSGLNPTSFAASAR